MERNSWPSLELLCGGFFLHWLHTLLFFSRSIFDIFQIYFNCITDKPEITVHPKNETKLERDNVVFTCNVDGNPVPTISWTRDGSLINNTNSNFTRISLSRDKKQLTITNLSRTDSGEYRCVASNSLGHKTSKAASLDVQCKHRSCCHPSGLYSLKRRHLPYYRKF